MAESKWIKSKVYEVHYNPEEQNAWRLVDVTKGETIAETSLPGYTGDINRPNVWKKKR